MNSKISEKYLVSVPFDDFETAKKACKLMSVTFPMLTFQLEVLPEVDLSLIDISQNLKGYLNE